MDCENVQGETHGGKGASGKEKVVGEYLKGAGPKFAENQGVKRGSHSGTSDEHPRKGWEPTLVEGVKDENLLAFVCTGGCRREILTKVYKNKPLGECNNIR